MLCDTLVTAAVVKCLCEGVKSRSLRTPPSFNIAKAIAVLFYVLLLFLLMMMLFYLFTSIHFVIVNQSIPSHRTEMP